MDVAGTKTLGRPPRLLFVLNSRLGAITAQVRGLIFREAFVQSRWTVEYVDLAQPNELLDRAARWHREDEIVKRAVDFDLVYLLRVNSWRLVERLRLHTSARLVFDMADALWNSFHSANGFADIGKILLNVDAIFSESHFMTRYGRRFHSRIHAIPACGRLERFDEWRTRVPARRDDRVVIGWVGSRNTVSALRRIAEPLNRLAERYPQMCVRVLSSGGPADLSFLRNARYSVLTEYDDEAMVREILSMDIGVAPPPFDLEDYCVRGPHKGSLYMGGGIPAVVQKAGDYIDIIRDGENGMLAGNQQEWSDKLDQLIASSYLRHKIGKKGLEVIRASRSLPAVFSVLETALLEILHLPRYAPSIWRRGYLLFWLRPTANRGRHFKASRMHNQVLSKVNRILRRHI